MGRYSEKGKVCREGFTNFYLDASCCMPVERDDYFKTMIASTWGLHADKSAVSEAQLAELESVIFEKVRQHTHGADDEGKTTKRFFAHFDLHRRGAVNAEEFRQTMEALGCTFRDHELKALFAKFSDDGFVNIEKIAGRFALRGTGNNPNINPVFGLSKEVPHDAIEKIRSVLKGKGMHGVRALVHLFRSFDKDCNAKLDRHEIQWVLKQNGQNLQPSEFERLFRYFDTNNDGTISIGEFIAGVRG